MLSPAVNVPVPVGRSPFHSALPFAGIAISSSSFAPVYRGNTARVVPASRLERRRVGPVGLFAHLLLVVDRYSAVDVDDLRYEQFLEWRRAFELGGEVFGETTQQARDDTLFLFAEEAAILIGDPAQS